MTDELVEKLDPTRSQGRAMVASYRAERAKRREAVREELQQLQAARRAARHRPPPPAGPAPTPASELLGLAGDAIDLVVALHEADVLPPGEPPTDAPGLLASPPHAPSVFANLVDAAPAVAPPDDAPPDDAQHDDAQPADAAPSAEPPVDEPASVAVAEDICVALPADMPDASPPVQVTDEPAAEPAGEDAPSDPAVEASAEPAAAPAEEGPLEIAMIAGFGPGMVLRLHQLGYRSAADLAEADPARLREALGSISRLLDIETWIEIARRQRAPD
jgi:predicted flap endonuclease-1-like 5' DNA nuclease